MFYCLITPSYEISTLFHHFSINLLVYSFVIYYTLTAVPLPPLFPSYHSSLPDPPHLHFPSEKTRLPRDIKRTWNNKLQDWTYILILRLDEATKWEEKDARTGKRVRDCHHSHCRIPQEHQVAQP